ncbi:MAG TPA: class I SAM-dependent methyltransferase [Gaiellaceae bacterium]|nr:class I SAM-dependent methyltransferase [Gaiellaceae bacterium]
MHDWHARQSAIGWDTSAQEHLPTRAEQNDVLLAVLSNASIGERAVLDLGCGSGLVAEIVLDELPDAHLVGVDFSDAMLERARERLERFGSRVTLVHHDLAAAPRIPLPQFEYAAAFSVQALHHLSDVEKCAAIDWATGTLSSRGVLVIVDRMKIPEALYGEWSILWRRLEQEPAPTYAEYLDELAVGGDRPSSLRDHLDWLEGAGLDASCLHLYADRAVLVGRKPLQS